MTLTDFDDADRYTTTAGIRGHVEIDVHDVAALQAAAPDWDTLDTHERLGVARTVTPTHSASSPNVTVREYHGHIARAANRNQAADVDTAISHLAIGDDDAEGVSITDSSLNNEQYRTGITNATTLASDGEFHAETFLDAGEANGIMVREVGLVIDAEGVLVNHATVLDERKTVNKTFTIDVELHYRDRGEVS